MNDSQMVVALKYKLNVPLSIKDGTWKKDGDKTFICKKIVPRSYVLDRNNHNNNELYIIDEDATAEMIIEREKNIQEKAKAEAREKVSMADLVEAVVAPKEEAVKKATRKKKADTDNETTES